VLFRTCDGVAPARLRSKLKLGAGLAVSKRLQFKSKAINNHFAQGSVRGLRTTGRERLPDQRDRQK
jgi:hypothetical protein